MHHATDLDALIAHCDEADSFRELADVAREELAKFGGEIHIVCGPITTGGRGSRDANMEIFAKAISTLIEEGKPVFNQEPYEKRLVFLQKKWFEEDPSRAGSYCLPLLEEFYRDILRSGGLTQAWFLPDWETSTGASWEHAQLTEEGVAITYLDPAWVEEISRAGA